MSNGRFKTGGGPRQHVPSTQPTLSAEQYAHGVRTGRFKPCDRFGMPIEIHDALIYDPDDPLVFQVTDVAPVLDHRAPQGLVRVVVQTKAVITMIVGQPTPHVLKYGTTDPKAGVENTDTTGTGTAPEGDPPAGDTDDGTRPDEGPTGGTQSPTDAGPPGEPGGEPGEGT